MSHAHEPTDRNRTDTEREGPDPPPVLYIERLDDAGGLFQIFESHNDDAESSAWILADEADIIDLDAVE